MCNARRLNQLRLTIFQPLERRKSWTYYYDRYFIVIDAAGTNPATLVLWINPFDINSFDKTVQLPIKIKKNNRMLPPSSNIGMSAYHAVLQSGKKKRKMMLLNVSQWMCNIYSATGDGKYLWRIRYKYRLQEGNYCQSHRVGRGVKDESKVVSLKKGKR